MFFFGIVAAIVLMYIFCWLLEEFALWALIVVIFAMIFSMFYRLKEIYEDVKLIKVHMGIHDPVMEDRKAVDELEHEHEREVERDESLSSINQEIEQELEASLEKERKSDHNERDEDK